MSEEPIGPGDEVFHVRTVLVAAVVLAPCQFAIEKAVIHWGLLGCAVILVHTQVASAE